MRRTLRVIDRFSLLRRQSRSACTALGSFIRIGTGRHEREMAELRAGRNDARGARAGAGGGDRVEGFNLLFAERERESLFDDL